MSSWLSSNPPVTAGDTGDADLIPGWGRSPEGDGNPLQYSCLGNLKFLGNLLFLDNLRDRGAWWAAVHRVSKSLTRFTAHARARTHTHTHTHTHTCEDVNYNFLLKSCWPLGLFFLSTCPSKFFRFPFTHGKAFHWTNHWNLNENSSQVYVVLFLEYPFLWQNLCFPISRQVGSMFSLPNYKSWSWNRVTQIRTRTHSLTLGLRT